MDFRDKRPLIWGRLVKERVSLAFRRRQPPRCVRFLCSNSVLFRYGDNFRFRVEDGTTIVGYDSHVNPF